MVIRREQQKLGTRKWSLSQVKWLARRLDGQSLGLVEPLGFSKLAQVYLGKVQTLGRCNGLDWLAVCTGKSGAQCLMAPDDFIQTLPQRRNVQRTVQADRPRQIVGWVARSQLVKKPQSLLAH
jgi:hypothetical protein